MIESQGKTALYPFMVNTIVSLTMPNETYQVFVKCLKKNCICYQRIEGDEVVREECWRDNIIYARITKKGDSI